jgi:hypothetical protein
VSRKKGAGCLFVGGTRLVIIYSVFMGRHEVAQQLGPGALPGSRHADRGTDGQCDDVKKFTR